MEALQRVMLLLLLVEAVLADWDVGSLFGEGKEGTCTHKCKDGLSAITRLGHKPTSNG